MGTIETLFKCAAEGQGLLPPELSAEYGGDLSFPAPPPERPYLIANFVSTLDGVVSFNIRGKSGGGPISGADPGDRFIMGLLRAYADVVLVGSGTVAAVCPNHLWVAEYINPKAADLYDHYRRTVLRKPKHPLIAIVTGTGRIDLSRAVFHTEGVRVLVLTTDAGCRTLTEAGVANLASVAIRALPAQGGRFAPAAILRLLKHESGGGLVLHEGGPTLLGQFLVDGLVDELFLTLAPQVAGRTVAHFRPAMVMGAEFFPNIAPWLDLLSVKRREDHLYLRYRCLRATAVNNQSLRGDCDLF